MLPLYEILTCEGHGASLRRSFLQRTRVWALPLSPRQEGCRAFLQLGVHAAFVLLHKGTARDVFGSILSEE